MDLKKLIFKIYGFSALIFGLFRLTLYFFQYQDVVNDQTVTTRDILSAFIWGLRYDLLITGFVVILPFILLIIYDFTRITVLKKIAFWWVFIVMGLAFMLTAANVVYYHKFYQIVTVKALEWFDRPAIVFGMIFEEPRYWFMFVPFFIILYIFYRKLKKWFNKYHAGKQSVKNKALQFLMLLILIFISIRGRVVHAPLRLEDAFTLPNNFLNELKLNPVFVFEKSYEIYMKDRLHPIKLMPEAEAVKFVQNSLHVTQPVNENPISREVKFDTVPNRKNVVLVLMESMATWKMAYFGNTEKRTPYLDSLFKQSIAFTNMYSNGIHTYAGIYGVNYAYPEIFDKHPLKGANIKIYNGLPQVLKENGYQTAFFIPHNTDFDNLGSFLPKNAYDNIYYERDYPKDSIRTIWGVDDHFLFNFAIKKLDKMASSGQNFLATILTISDHGPFYIPDYIKGENDLIRATRFADWARADFMHKAAKKPWFKNTVFLFVADHGEGHQRKYPIPLTYNHIPALFYCQGIEHQLIDKMSGQIDLFPTLMDILKLDYTNSTFGIDLFTDERPYIYFNHDKIEALIDRTHLLLLNRHKTIGLYHYKDGDLTDYKEQEPEKRKAMETYLKAHLQTAKYILEHDLQKF